MASGPSVYLVPTLTETSSTSLATPTDCLANEKDGEAYVRGGLLVQIYSVYYWVSHPTTYLAANRCPDVGSVTLFVLARNVRFFAQDAIEATSSASSKFLVRQAHAGIQNKDHDAFTSVGKAIVAIQRQRLLIKTVKTPVGDIGLS